MTLRTIRLQGALAERLGAEHRFHASSVAEAIQALCVMVPGARAEIARGAFEIVRESDAVARGVAHEDELALGLGAHVHTLHLVPRIAGAKRGGIGKILLGAVLIGASFLVPGSGMTAFGMTLTSGSVLRMGVSMVLSGIAQALAPSEEVATPSARDDERSNLYSDAANVAAPGTPIPVVFGRCIVGSVVVSGALRTERRAS